MYDIFSGTVWHRHTFNKCYELDIRQQREYQQPCTAIAPSAGSRLSASYS